MSRRSVLDTLSDSDTRTDARTASVSTNMKKVTAALARKAKQPIVTKLFEEAVEYTNDPFWQEKLSAAARGKMPKSFYYQDGYLIYCRKLRDSRVAIPNSPAEAVGVFINFLQTVGGIMSDRDVENNRHISQYYDDCKVDEPQIWTKIPKRMRKSMIESYVTRKTHECKFNKETAGQFRSLIFFGLKIGALNKDNIIINGTIITEINNIHYDIVSGTYYIDPRIINTAQVKLEKNIPALVQDDPTLEMHPMYSSQGVPIFNLWSGYVSDYAQLYRTFRPIQSLTRCDSPIFEIEDDDKEIEIEV